IKENPILSIVKLIIFPYSEKFVIERHEKFGGKIEFKNYFDLEKSFSERKIHPMDLKNSCVKYLSEILGKIQKKHRNI
ncbi:MAG: tyrosine--tRNA ligase, partial [Nanoarchaeota archaeon]